MKITIEEVIGNIEWTATRAMTKGRDEAETPVFVKICELVERDGFDIGISMYRQEIKRLIDFLEEAIK